MTTQLTFQSQSFNIVKRDNQIWLTSIELSKVLGYADQSSVNRIYSRHSDEFSQSMIASVKLTDPNGVMQETRIFSLRGAHLVAMFARTQIAKDFRKWVLNILDNEVKNNTIKAKPTTKALPHCLTVEQQKAIQSIVKSRVELLPENKRAKGAITCWSALKSKFGVTYKEIPESEFTEALNVVARIVLDGEVINEKPQCFKPLKWTRIGDQHPNANHGHNILSEVKRWLNASDDPVARDLHNALTDVGRVITTATTEMQEAIVNLQIGMHYLNRFRR